MGLVDTKVVYCIFFFVGTYNTSDLMLEWEEEEPVLVAKQLHLTEYTLLRHKTESSIRNTSPHIRGAFSKTYIFFC